MFNCIAIVMHFKLSTNTCKIKYLSYQLYYLMYFHQLCILHIFQTLHAAGQFEILRYWLTQLVPDKNNNKHKSIVIVKNKIIRKHQKIINFSEKIESLYTYVALVVFISNTIMICSIGFLIVTVSKRLLKIKKL